MTTQEVTNAVKNYLTKTEKHLFLTGDGFLYKIITLTENDKLYYATIFMGNGKVIIHAKEAASDSVIKQYGVNTLNVLENELFPSYLKVKALPYFKKMRKLIDDVRIEIKADNTANKALADKLKARLPELEQTV